MSLLKGVFGGQSDSLLSNLRKIIKIKLEKNKNQIKEMDFNCNNEFPLFEIISEYRGKNKDLIFDDDFIKLLLKTQKDDSSCFMILALLMPDLDFSRSLERDHLHPAADFDENHLKNFDFLKSNSELLISYSNKDNWNSIVNLHLLDASRNRSKQRTALKNWLENSPQITLESLLIPAGTPLEFESFPEFVEKRSKHLFSMLKNLGTPDMKIPPTELPD